MKTTRTYKVGKRTAKNYNEWMEHIQKEINKTHTNQFSEIKEQIQNDLITYLDGMDKQIVDDVCKIVVDNFNKKK